MLRLILFFILAVSTARADEPIEAPEVRVVGRRPSLPPPIGSAEVTGEAVAVEAGRVTSAAEAAARLPAIAVRNTGGEGSEPEFLMRGQDPHENRYFLEGVPLTDAEYQSSVLGSVPMDAISKIEAYPGGVPVSLASDGIGGALHFRLAETEPSSLRARGGSFGLREGAGRWRSGSSAFTVRGIFSDEDFVYFDDNGTPFNPDDDSREKRSHNRFRRLSVLPIVRLGAFRLFSLTSLQGIEVPGPTALPSTATLHGLYQIIGVSGSDRDWSGSLWYRGDWQRVQDPGRSFLGNYSLDRSASQSVGTRQAVRASGWEGVAQLSGDRFRADPLGGVSVSHYRWQVSAGSTWEIPFAGGKLASAALLVYTQYPASTVPARSFFGVSPRLGWMRDLSPRWRVRAAVGRHFRVPALAELHGAPTGLSPSAGLASETIDRAEAGADWLWPHPTDWIRRLRVSGTVSAAWARDLITYVANSQWSRVAVNVGRSRILSEEAAISVELPQSFSVGVQGAILQTENRSGVSYWYGKELPFRPRVRGQGGVEWARGPWRVAYSVEVWGSLYEDPANTRRRDPIWQQGVSFGWDGREWGEWRLEARNLTDVTTVETSVGAFRQTDTTTGYLGYPAPGRRIDLNWRHEL